MKNRTLLKTNILVCTIIAIGFAVTSIISYRSNFGVLQQDIEHVSALSADSLYNDISSIFAQPLHVSSTMANDSLLKNFLNEEAQGNQDAWMQDMQTYLNTYKMKYNYDSVFLVSTATGNYYHYEGLDRVLTQDNPENTWFYDFLKNDNEHELNIDNDEAKDNYITAFVNCKIKDDRGNILGVVGVGMKVDSLQTLLSEYEKNYGVQVYLINNQGIIEISSSLTGYEKTNIFDVKDFAEKKDAILNNRKGQENFWYSSNENSGYVATQYEANLKWHLVVENNTSETNQYINLRLFQNTIIILLIIIIILVIITRVIRRYNTQIIDLTYSQELEYQHMLHEMTVGLYEEIYELDITHHCAGGEGTRKYFESLGLPVDVTYEKALKEIAEKQIKTEFIQGYLETFSYDSVMKAYQNGISSISYEFMITKDGITYRWMRITARIFFWKSDNSIRMITYRTDIDEEKQRELQYLNEIQRDPMTGLYNKRITEQLIEETIKKDWLDDTIKHALCIFDIDNFKYVNDTMGHSYGDQIITEIATEIKSQFLDSDIAGRIGGDEFAVLIKNIENVERLKQKLARICNRIGQKDFSEQHGLIISCSIGVSLFPQDGYVYSELYEKADQALYHAKNHGKNSFVLFQECADNYTFHANQRDMEMLIQSVSDGLAQFACTPTLSLLYFNQKSASMIGIPSSILSSPNFDPMKQVHLDDKEFVLRAIQNSSQNKKTFKLVFRLRHYDGHYISVKGIGVYINELYKGKYPIFYIAYIKQNDTSIQTEMIE